MNLIRIIVSILSELIAEVPTTCEIVFNGETLTLFSVGNYIRVVSDNISIGVYDHLLVGPAICIRDIINANSYISPNTNLAIICGDMKIGIIHGKITCIKPQKVLSRMCEIITQIYPDFIPTLINRTNPLVLHPIPRKEMITLIGNFSYTRDVSAHLIAAVCLPKMSCLRYIELNCDQWVLDYVVSIIEDKKHHRPQFSAVQWCDFSSVITKLGVKFIHSDAKP